MTNSEIIIATITWARDEQESNWLSRAIEALASHALPVIVADGGSRVDFVNSLKQYPNIIFQPYQLTSHPRLLGQVKSALSAASELNPRYVQLFHNAKGLVVGAKWSLLTKIRVINYTLKDFCLFLASGHPIILLASCRTKIFTYLT